MVAIRRSVPNRRIASVSISDDHGRSPQDDERALAVSFLLNHHPKRLKTFSTTPPSLFSGPGVGGSNPNSPTIQHLVQPGDMGNRMYRSHG